MTFKEYEPKGGWISYRKRRAVIEKIKSTAMAFAGFAVFAVASTIVETI